MWIQLEVLLPHFVPLLLLLRWIINSIFWTNLILDLSDFNKMYKQKNNLKYINNLNTIENNPNIDDIWYQRLKGRLIAKAYNSSTPFDKKGSFQRHPCQSGILHNLVRKLVAGGVSHLSERLLYVYEPPVRCYPWCHGGANEGCHIYY